MPDPTRPALSPCKRLRQRRWPPGHLLNPATPYVPASRTDIRATFDRVRADSDRRLRR